MNVKLPGMFLIVQDTWFYEIFTLTLSVQEKMKLHSLDCRQTKSCYQKFVYLTMHFPFSNSTTSQEHITLYARANTCYKKV